MCPKGDDPKTVNQQFRKIRLDVHQPTSTSSGTLAIKFMKSVVLLNLDHPGSSACTNAFIDSNFAASVGCTLNATSNPAHLQYDITFYSWPISPQENNIFSHNGNPSIHDFFCDLSATSSQTTCQFTDLVKSNIRGIYSIK